MDHTGDIAVCPHRVCDHEHCQRNGHRLGGQTAVAFETPDGVKVMHIGCAPPRVRKAYYDFAREQAARGR